MGITKEQIATETDISFDIFDKIKDMEYNARHRIFNLVHNLIDQKTMEENKGKYGGELRNVNNDVAVRPIN